MNQSQLLKIFLTDTVEPIFEYISDILNIDRKGPNWIFTMRDGRVLNNVRMFVFINNS